MSTLPHDAHAIAIVKKRAMVTAIALPNGEAGVSTISSAAGRNSVSSVRLRKIVSTNLM
jgi:hypothetical protein